MSKLRFSNSADHGVYNHLSRRFSSKVHTQFNLRPNVSPCLKAESIFGDRSKRNTACCEYPRPCTYKIVEKLWFAWKFPSVFVASVVASEGFQHLLLTIWVAAVYCSCWCWFSRCSPTFLPVEAE